VRREPLLASQHPQTTTKHQAIIPSQLIMSWAKEDLFIAGCFRDPMSRILERRMKHFGANANSDANLP